MTVRKITARTPFCLTEEMTKKKDVRLTLKKPGTREIFKEPRGSILEAREAPMISTGLLL